MKFDLERIIKQHKYCFICRGNLIKKGFNYLQCKECGYRNYINPAPTTGAILENAQGEILLVERRVDPGKGLWDSPGGFVDMGENAEDGMIRELKEELDIDVTEIRYLCSNVDTYLFDGVEIISLGLIYIGKLPDQKITPHDDVAGYKLFKPEEIPFGKIAFEGFEQVLKKYISGRK